MKKSLIHKILVYSLSFIFVLEICFANASIVHANDNGDQVIDESVDLSEGQLENVTNLHWVEGSAATISWDAADGANYYDILVTVYDVNSSYMGSSTTGTSSLEIDVQQEIYNAINNSSLAINSDYARVIVTVYSMKTQDGEILEKSNGIDSSVLVYGYKIYQLPDAYDLVLTEDYVAQFKCDISNPNEAINNYFLDIYYSSGESYCCNLSTNQVACENGLFSVGIKEYIEEGYQQYGIDGIINVSYRIAMAGTLYYLDSGDRYFSNNVSFGKESTKTIQLPTATNLVLSDNYLLSCEYDSNIPYDAVRKVSLELKFIDENEGCWEFGQEFEASFPFNCEEGICCGNIERFIKEACVQFKLEGEVDVAARVMMVGTENYYDSTPSEYSNYIKYQVGSIRLPSATDVVLTDDYIAEFKCSIPNSDEIIKEVYISYAHVGKVNYGRRYRDLQWEGDTCRVDILDALKEGYLKYNLEGETEVIYRVEFTGSEGYYDSDPSEYSNAVPFYGILKVDAINLYPSKPILCNEHSYYLGKTITPENAYYNEIEWTSDNPSVVTVEDDGKITGISTGEANITAQIGDATDTVTVTVYDISSNIEDETDNQEVTDTAGDIIDDIVNNDNPDLSNTDINPEDLEEIKEEIQEAIDNGDDFHTDIKYIQEYFEKYKKNWGQIQKAAGSLNAQFEGAYNIEVEMYHKDKDDVEHHIGNITELENEVTFTFDLPTGMKEQQSGETKKYVLVRIHKNKDGETEYTPVDYTINDDGTFTAKSSEYSDFVWVGIEESSSEDDCSILGHKLDDGKVTKEATETTEGIMAYTCERCGETYTESIPKKEHEHNLKYTDAIEATCTEEGNYEYWYCDKCGKYYSDKDATNEIEENSYIISATGHKYDQKNYAKYLKSAATCTEKAVYYYSCGECGSVDYNHTFTSGNTLGHDWDEGIVTQETTETSEGIITYVCKRCNESHTESIPIKVHKHNLKQVNAQDATCTKEGNFEYWYCDKCGNYFSDKNASKQIVKDSYIIQAKGHKNNNKNTNSKYLKSVANCTKPAEYYYSCNECGEIDYDHTFTSGDALGHKWNEGKVTQEATETSEGIMTYTCERCGETYTESIPKKEHEHNLKHTEAIEATCTEEGHYEYWYCDKCGKYYSDMDATNEIEEDSYIISATGHNYDQKRNYAQYLKSIATCTEKAVYYYSCSVCGEADHNHTFTSGNTLGHDWDEGKVTQEATENAEGIKTFICSVCGETYTETIPKLDPVVIDPVKAFVTRFYTIILQRKTINDEEIEYYTSRLKSGELDGCSVAKGFIMSPEYTGKGEDDSTFVNKMYAAFFNREADDAAFYINLLESGYSREVVLAGFVNSPEFKTLCADYGINPGELIIDSQNNNHGNNEENNQGSNEDDITKLNLDTTNVDPDKLDAYVKNLYIQILGREYDEGGLQYWKEQIMTGTTYDAATAARVGFFESEEYKAFGKDSRGFVTDCYHAFLGRDPEPAGLEYWMNKLDSGEYSKQKVIDLGFGHSEEFKGILKNCGFRIIE